MTSAETEQARLAWQCRRGMLELDIFLATFLEQGYSLLDAAGRASFIRLLETPDQELLDYLMGRCEHTEVQQQHVIEAIRRATQA